MRAHHYVLAFLLVAMAGREALVEGRLRLKPGKCQTLQPCTPGEGLVKCQNLREGKYQCMCDEEMGYVNKDKHTCVMSPCSPNALAGYPCDYTDCRANFTNAKGYDCFCSPGYQVKMGSDGHMYCAVRKDFCDIMNPDCGPGGKCKYSHKREDWYCKCGPQYFQEPGKKSCYGPGPCGAIELCGPCGLKCIVMDMNKQDGYRCTYQPHCP